MRLQLIRDPQAPPRTLSGTTAYSDVTADSLYLRGHEISTFSTSVSLVEAKYYSGHSSSAGELDAARFAVDLIRKSIYAARIHSACGAEKWFIPQLTLEALMSTKTGISLVLGDLGSRPDNARLHLINEVLMGASTKNENDNKIYRKIFAVLLLIHKYEEIKHFVDEGVDDSKLPLKRVETKSGHSGLASYSVDGSHIQIFDSWTDEQKNDFIRLQWEVDPVFFRKHDEEVPHLKLLPGHILPYVAETGSQTTDFYDQDYLQGGFGLVSIYTLHPLQQNIQRYTVCYPITCIVIYRTCIEFLRLTKMSDSWDKRPRRSQEIEFQQPQSFL